MISKDYSYIVYNYDNVFNKLKILKKYDGKYKNEITDERQVCYTCTNSVRMYRKADKYVQAVLELYNKEDLGKSE